MLGSNLEATWTALEASALQEGYVQRGLYPDAPLDLFAGLQSTGSRMFIFACNQPAAGDVRLPASSDGLEIRRLQNRDYGENKMVCCITLSDLRYRDFFNVLIEDVCTRASGCAGEAEAYQTLVGRILEWQQFFARHSLDGLSEEKRRGLFGELSFLRHLVRAGILQLTGIGCWRGPFLADQDFQFRKMAVEAKVSLSAQNQEITISSERQLDSRNYDHFFVFHMALTVRRQNGETLNQIVDSVRGMMPAALQRDFEAALFQAGYIDAQRDLYEDGGYVIREENYFEVKEGFPRITEEQTRLVPGVGKVKYAISVPACKKFLVTQDRVFSVLRGLYA